MSSPTSSPTSTSASPGAPVRRRRSIRATPPLRGWRTVDILTVAFLGAAFGIAFWGWGLVYTGPLTALQVGYAPLMGLFVGPWLLAGVVGGLVVRRPGAALFCEVVAALVSMIPGTTWGAGVLFAGVLQGLGAELAFALLGYRFFGVAAAALAGLLSTPLEWLYETGRFPDAWAQGPVLSSFAGNGGYYAEWVWRDKLVYLGAMGLSGVVLAGVLGWLLTRALARAGALSAFPAGQELRESRAV